MTEILLEHLCSRPRESFWLVTHRCLRSPGRGIQEDGPHRTSRSLYAWLLQNKYTPCVTFHWVPSGYYGNQLYSVTSYILLNDCCTWSTCWHCINGSVLTNDVLPESLLKRELSPFLGRFLLLQLQELRKQRNTTQQSYQWNIWPIQ